MKENPMRRLFVIAFALSGFITLPVVHGRSWNTVTGFFQTAEEHTSLVGNEAEKWILAMEKNLSSARALQVSFSASMKGFGALDQKLSGTLTVADGNKMRFEGTSVGNDGKEDRILQISDGTRLSPGKESPSQATPPKLTDTYRNFLKHGGFLVGVTLSGSDAKGRAYRPRFNSSDFKLGNKETVAGHRAQVVFSKLSLQEAPEDAKDGPQMSFAEMLWLDIETNLPLRRIVTMTMKNKEKERKITFTESYSRFAINPKIEGNLFTLPK